MKSINWLILAVAVGFLSIFTFSLLPVAGGIQLVVMLGLFVKSIHKLQKE